MAFEARQCHQATRHPAGLAGARPWHHARPFPVASRGPLQHQPPAQVACVGSLAACQAVQWPAARHQRRPAAAAARAAASSGGQRVPAPGSANLSGLWVKDQQRSDTQGYEATLDVLGLSGLQKVTARLIEGIEVQQNAREFTVSFLTVVPFFKVQETAPFAGSRQAGRRDLRFGWQTMTAKQLPDASVLVEISWGNPMPGRLTEQYSLLLDGSLRVRAQTNVGGKSAAADSVYVRSSVGRDALLDASRRRNGSVTDVISKQKQQGLSM